MFSSGSVFLMENLEIYLKSYYWYETHQFYEGLHDYEVLIVQQTFFSVGMLIGAYLFNKVVLSIRKTVVISTVLIIFAYILVLVVPRYDWSVAVWSVFYNIGCGLNIITCSQCIWEYYPH